MAKRVLVTGCYGYLGGFLIPRLLEHPLINRVVGVDFETPAPPTSAEQTAPPGTPEVLSHPKFRFVATDIRSEYILRNVLEEEAVDVVFHLAFRNADDPESVLARETNIHGTMVLLEAADKSPRVQKLVIAGSTSAYGARRNNPRPLLESHQLRASGLAFAVHKRRIEEELAKALPQVRRSLQVSVLRLATVVGPSERAGGPVRRLCRLPFGVSALGRQGGLQFLSEEDAATAFCRALEVKELRGTFNVAPDDSLTLAEVCRGLGKRRVPLPLTLLWLGLFLGRRLFGTTIPEGIASYLAHPVVASNQKIKEALGLVFAHGSLEALLSCARSLQDRPASDASAGAKADLLF